MGEAAGSEAGIGSRPDDGTVAESARLAAVQSLRLLDTAAEERFDWVVRLAQTVFDVPMVQVNLIDVDRQFTKAAYPAEDAGTTTRRDWSFCTRTVEAGDQLVVADATRDPRVSENPLVTGDPRIRFYAGQPLTMGGQRVGALCLVDHEPRDFTAAEQGMLADLATWVEQELAADQEMRLGREMQRRLLPKQPPQLPGYDVVGLCITARDLSGDFYDWQVIDGRLQVLVADVMGKGVAAALVGAGMRTALRGASKHYPLQEAVNRTAAGLDEDLQDTGTFVTACVVRIDPATGDLEYVDAGHGLGLIVQSDGGRRPLRGDDLPIGLLPGRTLFDDADEAADRASAFLAGDLSVEAAIAAVGTLASSTTLEDDLTAVIVRRHEAVPAAG